MYFDYFDMLSGKPLLVEGVGRVRSPFLHELCPRDNGVPSRIAYNAYVSILTWEKSAILKYICEIRPSASKILNRPELSAFDVATIWPDTRGLYREALSFFIVEDLIWDDSQRHYKVVDKNGSVVGYVNRDNFDKVREILLQMNYIGLEKSSAPISHSSKASKNLWELAQKRMNELSHNNAKKDKPEYHLSNIISKVCSIHPSYNLFNIYDLTVFQLYDTFFQLGYIRSSNISERIFCHHGGDKFKFENWLKPIFKNI